MFPSILTCQCRHNVALSLCRYVAASPEVEASSTQLALLASAYQKFNIITPYASPSFSFSHIVRRCWQLFLIFCDFCAQQPVQPQQTRVSRVSRVSWKSRDQVPVPVLVDVNVKRRTWPLYTCPGRQAGKHLATIHIHLRCA